MNVNVLAAPYWLLPWAGSEAQYSAGLGRQSFPAHPSALFLGQIDRSWLRRDCRLIDILRSQSLLSGWQPAVRGRIEPFTVPVRSETEIETEIDMLVPEQTGLVVMPDSFMTVRIETTPWMNPSPLRSP
jgi:hypothetical protein